MARAVSRFDLPLRAGQERGPDNREGPSRVQGGESTIQGLGRGNGGGRGVSNLGGRAFNCVPLSKRMDPCSSLLWSPHLTSDGWNRHARGVCTNCLDLLGIIDYLSKSCTDTSY